MRFIAKPENLSIKLAHITFRNFSFLDAWMNDDGIVLRIHSLHNERENRWYMGEDENIFETLCGILGKQKEHLSINNVFQIGEGGFTKGYMSPICDLGWSDLLSTGTTLHFNILDSHDLRSDCEIQAAQMELSHTPFFEPLDMHAARKAAEIACAAMDDQSDHMPNSCEECATFATLSLDELAKKITNATCDCIQGASSLFVQNGLIYCGKCLGEIEDEYPRCSCLEPTFTRVLCGPDLVVSGQCYACGLRISKKNRDKL